MIRCVENDSMQHFGNNANVTSSASQYHCNSGGTAIVGTTSVGTATSEFHNCTVERTPESIKFFIVEELIYPSFVNSADNPLNSDFFFILKVAMDDTLGGTIGFACTEDTMEIDYISVCQ
ncbi:MAG: hypothetical protein HKN31_01580 [Pricia sp.]|nr:hypothetical protein [Pricia sp.]